MDGSNCAFKSFKKKYTAGKAVQGGSGFTKINCLKFTQQAKVINVYTTIYKKGF